MRRRAGGLIASLGRRRLPSRGRRVLRGGPRGRARVRVAGGGGAGEGAGEGTVRGRSGAARCARACAQRGRVHPVGRAPRRARGAGGAFGDGKRRCRFEAPIRFAEDVSRRSRRATAPELPASSREPRRLGPLGRARGSHVRVQRGAPLAARGGGGRGISTGLGRNPKPSWFRVSSAPPAARRRPAGLGRGRGRVDRRVRRRRRRRRRALDEARRAERRTTRRSRTTTWTTCCAPRTSCWRTAASLGMRWRRWASAVRRGTSGRTTPDAPATRTTVRRYPGTTPTRGAPRSPARRPSGETSAPSRTRTSRRRTRRRREETKKRQNATSSSIPATTTSARWARANARGPAARAAELRGRTGVDG